MRGKDSEHRERVLAGHRACVEDRLDRRRPVDEPDEKAGAMVERQGAKSAR